MPEFNLRVLQSHSFPSADGIDGTPPLPINRPDSSYTAAKDRRAMVCICNALLSSAGLTLHDQLSLVL